MGDVAGSLARLVRDPLKGLRAGEPTAVVLGDLTLVRPLGQESIAVVVGASDACDVTLRSRYARIHWPLPAPGPHSEAAEIASLRRLGQLLVARLGRKVPLFYGTDRQLELLYRHRHELGEVFLFLINDDGLGWALHDKASFYRLCEATGIRAPRVLADHELEQWSQPLLVKPRCKADWHHLRQHGLDQGKARAFSDGRAFLACAPLVALRDQLVIQELIPGDVSDLCSFHGFSSKDSDLLASFCGRKLHTFPRFGGESALIELVKDSQVARMGRAVVEKLGIKGPFKIDFIRDPRDGALVTLEVNARFNLWHYLGAAHGVNLLRIAYDYLVEGRVPRVAPDYTPHWRWLDGYRDYLAFREHHEKAGELGAWIAPLVAAPKLYDTFAWRDPWPYVHWLGRALGARLRRR